MLSLPEGVGLQLNSLGAYPHDLPGTPHSVQHLDFFSSLPVPGVPGTGRSCTVGIRPSHCPKNPRVWLIRLF